MTLAPMNQLMTQSKASGRGLGAFNAITLEHAEAIVAGAEDAQLPVVLQLSENTAAYHGSLAPLALACLRIAEDSAADVCVHLDHATSADLIEEAVGLGIPSVMVDASRLPHADNVRLTRELTLWCHHHGAWVEAELGEVGGKDGAHVPGVRTDPGEAHSFVADTGVDALAVAVGSSHAMVTRDAVLDEDLIARIAGRVPVPLVLHGSSGVDDAGLARAVEHGMVKVNIATHLNAVLTARVKQALESEPGMVDPRRYLGPGRTAVTNEVARLLRVLDPHSDATADGS